MCREVASTKLDLLSVGYFNSDVITVDFLPLGFMTKYHLEWSYNK